MPDTFPPWRTVYRRFARLRDAGTWQTINHHLVMWDRERTGREASPTAAVVHSQSVHLAQPTPFVFPVRSNTRTAPLDAPVTQPPDQPAAESPDDRAARHLRSCKHLTELALALAEAAAAKALQQINAPDPEPAADLPAAKPADHTRNFVRLSAAARQAMMLETRIAEAHAAARATRPDPRRLIVQRAFQSATIGHEDRVRVRHDAEERLDIELLEDLDQTLSAVNFLKFLCSRFGIATEHGQLPKPPPPEPAAPPPSTDPWIPPSKRPWDPAAMKASFARDAARDAAREAAAATYHATNSKAPDGQDPPFPLERPPDRPDPA